jgi:hypothetical protein
MMLIVSPAGVVGSTSDAQHVPPAGYVLIEQPIEYNDTQSSEWVFQDGALVHDTTLALARAQAERIARIKTEAAAHLDAIAWRLERAQEREAAGWATLADVDAVLAEREAIRRSSDAAEAAVLALTDIQAVQGFAWNPDDVAVAPPQRATHAAFLDALRAQGEDVIPSILLAKDSSPALLTWWTYFDQSEYIAGTDPRLEPGLQALEIAGLLPAGGAQAVLALLTGAAE